MSCNDLLCSINSAQIIIETPGVSFVAFTPSGGDPQDDIGLINVKNIPITAIIMDIA